MEEEKENEIKYRDLDYTTTKIIMERIAGISLNSTVTSGLEQKSYVSNNFRTHPWDYSSSPMSTVTKPKVDKRMDDSQLTHLYKSLKYIPVLHIKEMGFYDKERKIIAIYNNDGKLKNIYNEGIDKNHINLTPLYLLCKFKVKSVDKSSELFGRINQKRTLLNKIVSVSDIKFNVEVTKSDQLQNTLYVNTEEFGNLRMVLEDIEIIYPNIKGINPRKNKNVKNINLYEKVLIKRDMPNIGVTKNTEIIVSSIKTIGNDKYIAIKNNITNKNSLVKLDNKNFKKINCNYEFNSKKEKIIKKTNRRNKENINEIQAAYFKPSSYTQYIKATPVTHEF